MATQSTRLLAARDKAVQLRECYDAFLQDRRTTETSILQLEQLLETRTSPIATPLPNQQQGGRGRSTSPAATQRSRAVSFIDAEGGEQQPELLVYNVESDRWPLHGHLVPPEIAFQHPSPSGSRLGGRRITLQTRSTSLECILVEPMQKMMDPDAFVISGLAICLHGPDPWDDQTEDWAQLLKHTKLLDAGISVLLHEVPLNLVADVEGLVEAALMHLDVGRCLLIGKASGAPLAAAVAEADSRLVEACSLAGVLFVMPPQEDVPEACSRLPVPSFILGCRGDMHARDWIETVSEQDTVPVAWQLARVSGTDLAKIMRKDKETATAIRHFSIAALLMAEFANANGPAWNDSSQLPRHVLRLCEELPDHLTKQLVSTYEGGCQGQGLAAAASVRCRDVGAPTLALELFEILQSWIRRNLIQLATATE